ncbi:MAG: LytR family transcriptional regulator [Candidatus Kapabacteria bacterium]|nr:LytR family transcriptional regulator [Candidatus Kapabacteria bacterium]
MNVFGRSIPKGATGIAGWIIVGVVALATVVLLGSLVWRMLHPPISPLADEDDPRSAIQLEVVNASGRKGAGKSVLDFFRRRGFDVVEITTSDERPRRSKVVDRVGDRQSALKVARVLGVADTMVVAEIDSMRFLKASVVLGGDIDKLEPFAE